ncbi:MAG: hypothetical protein E3J56_12670 [Candidatus Aminicenantes bacterium]|nr:MAG: hypothetical protein E3J56_12670 [Candidatus Aminicenantes bacterium]
MGKIAISRLILDFNLYPRHTIDDQHVHYIIEAMKSNGNLPPIIADKESKRVVDGFHRVTATKKLYGENAKINVIFKTYHDEGEIFRDAMRYNADHGRMLTKYDRVRCLLVADELGIEPENVAKDLKMSLQAVGELRADRVGKLNHDDIPIKRTIRHMAGRQLTDEQVRVNKDLSGMPQLFYVNQLIKILRADLLDRQNEQLLIGLRELRQLIETEVGSG